MSRYDRLAYASHGFASQLERRWAEWFFNNQWNYRYIGVSCHYADFEVDGIKIEVKPEGDDFVAQACDRGSGFLIVDGSPGYARWWAVEEKGSASRIGSPKVIVEKKFIKAGTCNVPIHTHRMETVSELIERNHVKFKESLS